MLAFRTCKWGALLGFLLLRLAGQAQVSSADKAQFQRRLRDTNAGHRYWDAPPDSLGQVLASQRADTARLHTLEHLFNLGYTTTTDNQEILALATRLHYPERLPFRLVVAADRLREARPVNYQVLLDTLQAAQRRFNALGPTPVVNLIRSINNCYRRLKQPVNRLAELQQQLAYYQQHGPRLNVAICDGMLGGYYHRAGDYSQSISYMLHATELARCFSNAMYYNDLGVIGAYYVEWGNASRALPYLQQVLAWPQLASPQERFINRTLATSYSAQKNYPLALRYATLTLRPRTASDTIAPEERAFGLVQQSAALLGLGQVAAVRPLLQQAQHLADSVHMVLDLPGGNFELVATWARYYAATGDYPRAEAAWQAAYRQARLARLAKLRLAYLQELAHFYQQRGQPTLTAPYALAALLLADSLATIQSTTQIARYELVRADRTQQARIARLRLTQVQQTARARRQRLLLGATLLVLALVTGLGYVLWRGSHRRQRANEALSRLNAEVTTQRDQTTRALTELQLTQQQLIQKEKMASLGELTAGIAHEIQNPLNFVTNFSDVSAELVTELDEALAADDKEEAVALATDLRQNLTKIHQHGQRASRIVRGMLEHSRQSTGERQPTEVNALAEEYLRLAYQGLRAKDQSFNVELQPDLTPNLPLVEAVPGELGRVLLNLFTNAFYAVQERQRTAEPGYVPLVSVQTRQVGQEVQLQVQDNGTGMSAEVQAKVFQPFFTTKPPGEGTGLGLSLSYDIITQGHGGMLTVDSQPGQGSTFTVRLPAHPESPSVPG